MTTGEPVNVLFVVWSLAAGGAERVISILANQSAARGWPVTIVTLSSMETDAYALDPRVRRVGLDLEAESRSVWHAIVRNVRKIVALRRAVRAVAPDVVISFVDRMNVLSLIACAGLAVPILVSERTHPSYHPLGRGWSLLRRLTYPFADAVVVQSQAVRAWGERLVRARRVRVIANPVGDPFSPPAADDTRPRRSIVLAVGRLGPEKGFDVLLRAFLRVSPRHPAWSLQIIGQGPSEAELRGIVESSPHASVVFAGPVGDPERYYREASVFVVSSRYEGFPNVLLEAMASGCAVISTACPGGAAEIVRHGVDGLLVPPDDVAALAVTMERLMADAGERQRLGARAVEGTRRFRPERIMALWDDVIASVRAGGGTN